MDGNAPFHDVILAINFNHPFYQNVPVLIWYYQPLFSNYILCGPESNPDKKYPIVVINQPKEQYGYYGYQCLTEAVRRKPGFSGYFYVNDDMIINWWNFYKLDRTKIWFPNIQKTGQHKMDTGKIETFWWNRADCLKLCSKAFKEMEADPLFTDAVKLYLENVGNERACSNGLSDAFYIPGRLAKKYAEIAQRFYDNRVFLEVSTPMTLLMLDRRAEIIDTPGLYIQMKYGWGQWTSDSTRAWLEYNYETYFLHPYKFTGNNRTKNTGEFEERVLKPSQTILKDRCLDVVRNGKFWK